MTQTLTVPLFPLPRTVLFPGVRLPFYVFEPRYRRMLADLLDGPGLVGIPQVLPGFESASSGAPPFNQIFGVGEIGGYTSHEDGTSHIEVVGVHRVRLLEEFPIDVYRRARVEILDESEPEPDMAEVLRDRLSAAVKSLLPLAVPRSARDPLERFLEDRPTTLSPLINTLSTVLIADARTRQSLLEIEGIDRRGRRLASQLEELRRSLRERPETRPDHEEAPSDET